MEYLARLFLLFGIVSLLGCSGEAWNNPYPKEDAGKNILYSAFGERPKHLDPARSYNSNEYAFIGQIYEPPLQYHYLKRPYELIPLTAERLPSPEYYDAHGKLLPSHTDVKNIAESVYTVNIRSGILYQPHPALAVDARGKLLYSTLTDDELRDIRVLGDFKQTGTRELTAADYVHQIKRLAHPAIHSPIFGIMSDYIVGLKELGDNLQKEYEKSKDNKQAFLDLEKFSVRGVEVVDRYTYRIRVKGVYPQLVYWLAMPFFAPMPPEADRFYSQPGLIEKNITLDWYPIGTGAYQLTINNPNRQMVLEKNPHFRGDLYPRDGDTEDMASGMLGDAGKPMPFIEKVVYNLETESIPYWNKFLQGYYDTSGINSESFDQAVQFSSQGDIGLSDAMRERDIQLSTSVAASSFYLGFNMRDPVVGGYSDAARKLRQAISIAYDTEEFISIFMNGRGIPAQGPLPPGIFGYRDGEAGANKYVYDWNDGAPKRKSLALAKQLLAEAGYPNGIDAKSGKPLVLHLDITASGPEDKARLSWYRKQFEKINIQLDVRNTLYNRFQEKMSQGTAQIFVWGWNADYPDPENFMFLLYGPNRKMEKNGENAANYENSEFDRLFDVMKNMSNGPERQAVIDKMTDIVRRDAPWLFGLHPKDFALYHAWYKNSKPNLMAHNTLQYKRIDTVLREQKRREWNEPVTWPLWLILVLSAVGAVPAYWIYWTRVHRAPKRA